MILSQMLFQSLLITTIQEYFFSLYNGLCHIRESGIFRYASTIDKKPVWSLWMIFGKNPFYSVCKQLNSILYDTFNNMIGLQFFRNCRGLSPFVSNVIRPSFCEEDRLSFLKLSFIARTNRVPISFQKNLEHSTVNPSEPGLVPFFIRFNVDRTSSLDILPSKLLHCSSVSFGMFSCSGIISSKLTSLICSSCLYK